MNKLLITLILIGVTVTLAPAILVGLGIAWAIIWPVLTVVLLIIGISLWSSDSKARNNFLVAARSKGLTRKQAFEYQIYTYKKDAQYMNSAQWNQLTADLDAYANGIKGHYGTLEEDVKKVTLAHKRANRKTALSILAVVALFVFIGVVSK